GPRARAREPRGREPDGREPPDLLGPSKHARHRGDLRRAGLVADATRAAAAPDPTSVSRKEETMAETIEELSIKVKDGPYRTLEELALVATGLSDPDWKYGWRVHDAEGRDVGRLVVTEGNTSRVSWVAPPRACYVTVELWAAREEIDHATMVALTTSAEKSTGSGASKTTTTTTTVGDAETVTTEIKYTSETFLVESQPQEIVRV